MSDPVYPQTLFVLGTHRNVGKTVTCIGLVAKLLSDEHDYSIDEIGYIKPVGQQTLTVLNNEGVPVQADKDAVVLTTLMGISSPGYEQISPVIWRGGLTASFIDEAAIQGPQRGKQAFMRRIREAYEQVAVGKRIVVVEGTGQPGVGSVAGISNGDVINALRDMGVPVFVVMVSRAGIGSMSDQVFPYLMAPDHLGTRVDGIIVNDVLPAKLDKIRHYLQTYYDDVFPGLYGDRLLTQLVPPILGFVPSIPELRMPTMRLITERFRADKHSGLEIVSLDTFEQHASHLVRSIEVVNLRYGYERYVKAGDAVIVGINANDAILSVVLHHERLISAHGRGLSGLILSCKSVGGLSQQVRQEVISIDDLPTIALDYDTADIVLRVGGLSVKIQPYDVDKKQMIDEVFQEHLTLWPELHAVPG